MVTPIWSATWEIECCQPEAEVGYEWAVPIVFTPASEPWWTTYGGEATDAQRSLGTLTLEPIIERTTASGEVVATAGRLCFRMPSAPVGPTVGRLGVDAHSTGTISNDEVTIRGVVVRIELVPLRYERRDRMYVPVEQLEPIDAPSTLDRDKVTRRRRVPHSSEFVQPLLLIWIDPDDH